MSKIGIFLAALLLATFAFAQDTAPPPPPAQRTKHNHEPGDAADKRLKRLSKRLNLSDEQKEKMRPILQDEDQQVKAVDGDSTLTQQQKRQKARQIRRSSKTQMDAVLTPEQRAQIPGKRQGNGGHHKPSGTTAPPASDSNPTQ